MKREKARCIKDPIYFFNKFCEIKQKENDKNGIFQKKSCGIATGAGFPLITTGREKPGYHRTGSVFIHKGPIVIGPGL